MANTYFRNKDEHLIIFNSGKTSGPPENVKFSKKRDVLHHNVLKKMLDFKVTSCEKYLTKHGTLCTLPECQRHQNEVAREKNQVVKATRRTTDRSRTDKMIHLRLIKPQKLPTDTYSNKCITKRPNFQRLRNRAGRELNKQTWKWSNEVQVTTKNKKGKFRPGKRAEVSLIAFHTSY